VRSVGYRIGGLAYCTDCSSVPDDAVRKLSGLDTLVLGMLRERPHPAHMSLQAALAAAARISARQTFFVHMCHDISHAACSAALPEGFRLAHDGLTITVREDSVS
jgi:phosphoribosyl 1,2-cyclic phosphate phosphodiesterase